MYGIRWLAAAAVAFAACITVPDAHAQTWLRWGKAPAREQTDPSKVLQPARQTVTVTLPAVAPSARVAVAEPVAAQPALRGPSVTIIEEARPALASVARPVVPGVSPAIPTTVAAPATLSPPLYVPVATYPSATATPLMMIEDASVQSAPLVAAAATVPSQAALSCSDCPTLAEMKATSNAPKPAEMAPEDQKLQSEIKRRLLQER